MSSEILFLQLNDKTELKKIFIVTKSIQIDNIFNSLDKFSSITTEYISKFNIQ